MDNATGTHRVQVKLTMICPEGHIMGTYVDSIADKYPLWCDGCDDTMSGKYPFIVKSQVIYNLAVI